MSTRGKLLAKLANPQTDGNWTLEDAVKVLEWHGFIRTGGRGSHRVYGHPGLDHSITLAAHGKHLKSGYIRNLRHILAQLK